MPLHTSGSMSLNQIRGEFGGSGQLRLSQFYRGGGRVPNSPKNYSISTGGRIAHSMFYGTSKELTAKEVVDAAYNGRLAFSRWFNDGLDGYNPNTFPDGLYINNAWGRKNYQLNLSSDFFNDGWEKVDDWCTIAITQGQEYSFKNAPNQILSVTHINGSGLGASFVGSYVTGAGSVRVSSDSSIIDYNRCLGGTISIYHVNADRRDIRKIVTAFFGPSMNSVRAASVHIFPGRLTVVSAKTAVANGTQFIAEGDIIVWGQRSYRKWEYGISGVPGIVAGREWYAYCSQGVAYGLDSRYFSTSYGLSSGIFADGDSRVARNHIVLRKLQDGESAQTYDRCSSSLRPYRNYGVLRNSHNGYGQMYVNTVLTTRAQDVRGMEVAEKLTYVSHSVSSNSSGWPIVCRVDEGEIVFYADAPDDAFPRPYDPPVTYTFTATVTVRTLSGRTITGTITRTGTLTSYMESTGGD